MIVNPSRAEKRNRTTQHKLDYCPLIPEVTRAQNCLNSRVDEACKEEVGYETVIIVICFCRYSTRLTNVDE